MKSNFIQRHDVEFTSGLMDQSTDSILYMSGGDVVQVVVRDERVIGNFTNNKAVKRNKRSRRFRKCSFGLIDREYWSQQDETNQQNLDYLEVKKKIWSKID